jgi:hypothetical protein
LEKGNQTHSQQKIGQIKSGNKSQTGNQRPPFTLFFENQQTTQQNQKDGNGAGINGVNETGAGDDPERNFSNCVRQRANIHYEISNLKTQMSNPNVKC